MHSCAALAVCGIMDCQQRFLRERHIYLSIYIYHLIYIYTHTYIKRYIYLILGIDITFWNCCLLLSIPAAGLLKMYGPEVFANLIHPFLFLMLGLHR